jgi:hypothetical protein
MSSKFNFVVDRIVRNKAYPALTTWQARPYTAAWREFGQHWPHTVPVELFEHCRTHNYPYEFHWVKESWPPDSFYCIGLGFFDFAIDYFALMPAEVSESLRAEKLTVLFYYHEGDSPADIKQRLDQLCQQHKLSSNCYRFVSGNTAAASLKGFAWFPDHELLYWQRNQSSTAAEIHQRSRNQQFTVLSRTHKWWRAVVMTDLQNQNLLNQSFWSYSTELGTGESESDCPIEIDTLNIRDNLYKFLSNCPYSCDSLSIDQHNDHHNTVYDHYTDSYCSIVLETHYDADSSRGAFLTEKTFKAIKHGHPFVIVGCAGSLQALRELGYRTFDHAIDNNYDTVSDNTQRWIKCRDSIAKLQQQDMHKWFDSCRDDIEHNQKLFNQRKFDRLNTLLNKLQYT